MIEFLILHILRLIIGTALRINIQPTTILFPLVILIVLVLPLPFFLILLTVTLNSVTLSARILGAKVKERLP